MVKNQYRLKNKYQNTTISISKITHAIFSVLSEDLARNLNVNDYTSDSNNNQIVDNITNDLIQYIIDNEELVYSSKSLARIFTRNYISIKSQFDYLEFIEAFEFKQRNKDKSIIQIISDLENLRSKSK